MYKTDCRHRKYRRLLPLAFLPLLWACQAGGGGGTEAATAADKTATDKTATDNSTIIVATTSDMRGVNELVANSTIFHQSLHYYVFFLTLLDEQADFQDGPPTFKPRLAESYEFSDDRKTLTFKLRPGHLWSDGTPITAEDVRWTWEAQIHPDVGWPNAAQKKTIEDVEVVDPRTVRFHFNKVTATQLIDVNHGVILPKHAWSELPFSKWRQSSDWFIEHMVVSGPFALERWDQGERIVVRRNEYFHEPGLPRAERIIFRIVPDRSSQLAMLRSGQAHIVEWARPADAMEIQNHPDTDILAFYPRSSNALIWNLSQPLFEDREIRQALTLALDRERIIQTLYHGYAKINESLFPEDLWAHNHDLEPWPYDPDRARKMLADQGWIDSDGDGVRDRDGQRFSFEILTAGGNELRQDILVMVQDQLARVGVEARQRVIEFNTQLARARAHDFEALFMAVGIPTDLDFSSFFHSDAIAAGYNMASYSNSEVDGILVDIKGHTDQLAARPLYLELQARLHEDMPLTILYEPQRLLPIRTSLRGVSPNVLSTYNRIQDWEVRD